MNLLRLSLLSLLAVLLVLFFVGVVSAKADLIPVSPDTCIDALPVSGGIADCNDGTSPYLYNPYNGGSCTYSSYYLASPDNDPCYNGCCRKGTPLEDCNGADGLYCSNGHCVYPGSSYAGSCTISQAQTIRGSPLSYSIHNLTVNAQLKFINDNPSSVAYDGAGNDDCTVVNSAKSCADRTGVASWKLEYSGSYTSGTLEGIKSALNGGIGGAGGQGNNDDQGDNGGGDGGMGGVGGGSGARGGFGADGERVRCTEPTASYGGAPGYPGAQVTINVDYFNLNAPIRVDGGNGGSGGNGIACSPNGVFNAKRGSGAGGGAGGSGGGSLTVYAGVLSGYAGLYALGGHGGDGGTGGTDKADGSQDEGCWGGAGGGGDGGSIRLYRYLGPPGNTQVSGGSPGTEGSQGTCPIGRVNYATRGDSGYAYDSFYCVKDHDRDGYRDLAIGVSGSDFVSSSSSSCTGDYVWSRTLKDAFIVDCDPNNSALNVDCSSGTPPSVSVFYPDDDEVIDAPWSSFRASVLDLQDSSVWCTYKITDIARHVIDESDGPMLFTADGSLQQKSLNNQIDTPMSNLIINLTCTDSDTNVGVSIRKRISVVSTCDPVSCDLNDGLKSCSDSFTGDYYDYSCVGGVCQPSISSVSCAGGEVCVSSGSSASCQSCSVSDEFASSSVSGTCCPGTYDDGGLCCSDPQTIAGVTYVWYNAGGYCQQANPCGSTVGVDVSDVSKLPPYVVSSGGYACCPNIEVGGVTSNWRQEITVY